MSRLSNHISGSQEGRLNGCSSFFCRKENPMKAKTYLTMCAMMCMTIVIVAYLQRPKYVSLHNSYKR